MSDPEASRNLHDAMPFTALLDIETLEVSAEQVQMRLAFAPQLCTANGMLHGGVLMSLADTCGAVCSFLNLPEGAAGTSTIQSSTNFLRAVREGTVTATSRPLHKGRRVIAIETEVVQADGRLVAKVIQTQSVLTT